MPLDRSVSPVFPNQRGDSGRKSIPINCKVDGTPARPNIKRQLGASKNASETEKSYAKQIIALLNAMTLPLISIGAISDR